MLKFYNIGAYSSLNLVYSKQPINGLTGPRNSFFLVVANFCYQVQDQVAKLILW